MRAIVQPLLLAALTFGASACIDEDYVGGAPCGSSFECPPPPVEEDDPIGTTPEQCVSTGSAFICVPMPFSRPPTPCPTGSECQTAGFPIEAQCLEGTCQCPGPIGTPPQGCVWNPQTCACGGVQPAP